MFAAAYSNAAAMDGIHDIGGMAGFGSVEVEVDEPLFHEPWERRAFAVTVAGARLVANGSRFRHAIERMDPAAYLTTSYYEHWLTGIATLLVETGRITREDLEARAPGFPLSRPDRAPVAVTGADVTEPRFLPGDRVRVREWHPLGHTRCPRYVQGRLGTIARVDVVASLPDVEAHSRDNAREKGPTYSVRFEAEELWGEGAEDGAAVTHADLWEAYLVADPGSAGGTGGHEGAAP